MGEKGKTITQWGGGVRLFFIPHFLLTLSTTPLSTLPVIAIHAAAVLVWSHMKRETRHIFAFTGICVGKKLCIWCVDLRKAFVVIIG